MKIYVVTSGEYSDYQIHGALLRKESAERLAFVYHGEIEEYDSDQVCPFPLGMRIYSVWIHKDTGEITIVQSATPSCETDIDKTKIGPGFYDYLAQIRVWAEDEKRACQLATEIRNQMLKENKWYDIFKENKWYEIFSEPRE